MEIINVLTSEMFPRKRPKAATGYVVNTWFCEIFDSSITILVHIL